MPNFAPDLFSFTPPPGVDVIGRDRLLSDSVGDGTYRPLADRLRPQSLDEYVGQSHLLGPARRCAAPWRAAARTR
jgi:hypothetical protein